MTTVSPTPGKPASDPGQLRATAMPQPVKASGAACAPGGAEAADLIQRKGTVEQVVLFLFIFVPFAALLAAVPVAWGWGLGWRDIVITVAFYTVAGLGITVGFHRHFTHGSFKAKRQLRMALGIAGSIAIEGGVITWVADHRKHHSLSDKEGDPHSPWRYGESIPALLKGLWWAHTGWLFDPEKTPKEKYAPDLLKDPVTVKLQRQFPLYVAVSVLAPPLIGGLWSWSWQGALTAFFWGSLVRISMLHHVTWSINSICHAVGQRPFNSRDRSGNVWWLAIPSFGESWHNLHHADPTCARHGVDKGQVDVSARTIWLFEKAGWAWDVRWPKASRLDVRRV